MQKLIIKFQGVVEMSLHWFLKACHSSFYRFGQHEVQIEHVTHAAMPNWFSHWSNFCFFCWLTIEAYFRYGWFIFFITDASVVDIYWCNYKVKIMVKAEARRHNFYRVSSFPWLYDIKQEIIDGEIYTYIIN